jgi:excisionase family DNA binding protein
VAGFLTTKQAAGILNVAPATIRDWARRGLLTRYRQAGRRVWACAELAVAQDAPKQRRSLTGDDPGTTVADQSA